MAENIETVLPLIDNETKIIPGHGPLSTKADLIAYKNMLKGTYQEVKKHKGTTIISFMLFSAALIILLIRQMFFSCL